MASNRLFALSWKQRFMERSSALMSSIRQRHQRKKLPPPDFDLEQLRGKLLSVLGSYDGVVQCRYCGAWVDVLTLAGDHAIPIKRGGSLGLENYEFPCQGCNYAKGGLTPDEFLALNDFLKRLHPHAAEDIRHRLRIAVQLAGQSNWNRKKQKKGLIPCQ